MRWLVLFALLVFAGCADAADDLGPDGDSSNSSSDGNSSTSETNPGSVENPPIVTTNLTQMHLRERGHIDELAIEFELEFSSDTSCGFSFGVASHSANQTRMRGLAMLREVGEDVPEQVIVFDQSSIVSAHALVIDTYESGPDGGKRASRVGGTSGLGEGSYQLLVLASGLDSWDSSAVGNFAYRLDLECQDPFDIVAASEGDRLTMTNAAMAEGGVGATLNLFTLGVLDQMTYAEDDNGATVACQAENTAVARVAIASDQGDHDWTLMNGQYEQLTGVHDASVTLNSIGIGEVWCAGWVTPSPFDFANRFHTEAE